MRSKCFSRFAFIGNAQLSQIFESQGCVRTETVDELYNQKVRKTKQIHPLSALPYGDEPIVSNFINGQV